MNIHQLHIFAKNRDAIASQKGYTYQQLKTLEDWIENRIIGGSCDIYCDYEDDIFARDISQKKSIFTQIKLYKTDFSFASDGLQKAIAHFFSLYVKGEYAFDAVEFIFETNASIITNDVRGNDVDLLRKWVEEQDNLNDETIAKVRSRIKSILEEYIKVRNAEIEKKTEAKSDLQTANIVFKQLTEDDYDAFIRCIKWRFDGTDINTAMQQTLTRINELIPKIPLPLNGSKTNTYNALLVREIFHRSSLDDPEDRKLTSSLLDAVLLNSGEREDRLYAETFEQVKAVPDVRHYFPGALQSTINSARYCRWKRLDSSHKLLWVEQLMKYYHLQETPFAEKRRALYEYLFLKIGHDLENLPEQSPIRGDADLIRFYFQNWEKRNRIQDIETDITLLQLIRAQIRLFEIPIGAEEIQHWEINISEYLETRLQTEQHVDSRCELLELKGHLIYQMATEDKIDSCKQALDTYRQILPLLKDVQYYSLADLYGQMKEMINMLATYGNNDELSELVEQFKDEISVHAEKSGFAHKSAQELIERAGLHLKKRDLANFLKALDLFHRAKELWRSDYTKEPYMICLLGISEVYSSLGMTYAAKYYALLAFWCTWQTADPALYKHLQKAFGLIQELDFKHGAWIHAILDCRYYLLSKREFDLRGFDIDNDREFKLSAAEIATIIHSSALLLESSDDFVDKIKAMVSDLWEHAIGPVVKALQAEIPDREKLNEILIHKLVDSPFNDTGKIRKIRFKALGNIYCITFENNPTMNFIGESFVSLLQLILCEIAKKDSGIFKKGQTIDIEVYEGIFQKELIAENSWKLSIPEFDGKLGEQVQMHYAYLSKLATDVLQHVSLLDKKDFNAYYMEWFNKNKMGNKVLEASSYQRVIRHTIGNTAAELKIDPKNFLKRPDSLIIHDKKHLE